MNDTRHQCRWCAELTTGNGIYCGAKKKELAESTTKRVNTCKMFRFVNMDAYDFSEYKERADHQEQIPGQLSIGDLHER